MNDPTLWKQAAAKSIDDSAVESAFMRQAYGYVENKSKPLFKDPFRLGFEVVHKNEKSTKMIGMFAFRVGSTLIYAPVFFLNGDIKGADMLYRGDVKRFIPNNNDWCSFLVEDHAQKEGTLQSPNTANNQRTRLERIAYPQGGSHHKSASEVIAPWDDYKEAQALNKEAGASYGGMLNLDTSDLGHTCEGMLGKILGEGPEVMEKLASLLEGSDIAQQYILENYGEDVFDQQENWDKKAHIAAQNFMSKKASADASEAETGLLLYTDPLHADLSKSAATKQKTFEYGYGFEDRRPLEGLTEVFNYEDSIKEVNDPGVYDVCAHPDKIDKCIILNQCHTLERFLETHPQCDEEHQVDPIGVHDPSGPVPFRDYRSIYCIDSKEYCTSLGVAKVFGSTAGKVGKLSAELGEYGTSIGSLKTGKVYVLFEVDSGRVTEPVKIKKKVSRKDYTEYQVEADYSWDGESTKSFLYRGDYENANAKRGMFNDGFMALEVKTSKRPQTDKGFRTEWTKKLMSRSDIRSWTLTGKNFMKSATISHDTGIDSYDMDINGVSIEGLSRRHAITFLAKEAFVKADDAEMLVDEAKSHGSVTTTLNFATQEKSAAYTQITDQPHFTKDYDSQLGVTIDNPQRFTLSTETHQPHRDVAHFGDSYKGEGNHFPGAEQGDGLPEEVILGAHPDELASLAEQSGVSQVFDHGMVGTLAEQSYDSISQVEDYIPDLEKGLDRQGRILFLFRYKPSDFEEAYGADNMKQMEQQLTSEFASHGDLVLRLIKRNRDAKTRSSNLI